MLVVLCDGFEFVQSLCLLGRMEPDLDQVEWADEAVADPKTAGAHNRVAQRDRPMMLEQDQRRRVIRVGGLRIDLAAREAWIGGARVDLTAKEYELLRCLASEPTRVLTKVNFELPKTEGSQESKYSGSGRDW